MPVAPSVHTPNGVNTILTADFKDDLKSLEAAIYSLMKGHLKKKNGFIPRLKTNTFWKFPWGTGEGPGAELMVGLELGNPKKVSAD